MAGQFVSVAESLFRHSERSEESWPNGEAGQILRCAQNDRLRALRSATETNSALFRGADMIIMLR
jgi:hypothetical protein